MSSLSEIRQPMTSEESRQADEAIVNRNFTSLTAEDREMARAVLNAFEKYENGDDEAARQELNKIGLKSSYLDWKLLLRGLIAFSGGDNSRAIENWQRLDPQRIPARLAAPLRGSIDKNFSSKQDPSTSQRLLRQLHHLTGAASLLSDLQNLQRIMNTDRKLAAPFRDAKVLLPRLKEKAPHLVPRLGRLMYRAILEHGEPSDLPRYKQVFGEPPDDVGFHRLEALALEHVGMADVAAKHWRSYLSWLKNQFGLWNKEIRQQVSAMIYMRLADLGQRDSDYPAHLAQLIEHLINNRGKKIPGENPVPHWKKAMELAPNWPEPVLALLQYYYEHNKLDEAEQVANDFLSRVPDSVPVLGKVADGTFHHHRFFAAIEYQKRIHTLNPLDRTIRMQLAGMYTGVIRLALQQQDFARAEALLAAGGQLCLELLPVSYYSLTNVIQQRPKKPREKVTVIDRCPGGEELQPVFHYMLSVDTMLAKWPAAARKPLDAKLAELWCQQLTPTQVLHLAAGIQTYLVFGIKYRGCKTHEKELQSQQLLTLSDRNSVADIEAIAEHLASGENSKFLKQYCVGASTLFPKSPVFPLLLLEDELRKGSRRLFPRRVANEIKSIQRLISLSGESRYQPLLERLQRIQENTSDQFALELF